MIGKQKVTFIFDPSTCSACHSNTGGKYLEWKFVVEGVERRFRFCAACIDGQPTDDRCRELLRRMIGFEDAIERGEEEQRIKQLLEID
jgi:hypothetical protein